MEKAEDKCQLLCPTLYAYRTVDPAGPGVINGVGSPCGLHRVSQSQVGSMEVLVPRGHAHALLAGLLDGLVPHHQVPLTKAIGEQIVRGDLVEDPLGDEVARQGPGAWSQD